MATTVVTTIRPSGGDYTTVTAWEAAQNGNLVTADEVRVGELGGFSSSGLNERNIEIDGGTMDATRYLELRVEAASRHAGKWDPAKLWMYWDDIGGGGFGIKISDTHVRISGIQYRIGYGGSTAGEWGIGIGDAIVGTSDIRVEACIVKQLASSAGSGDLFGFQASDPQTLALFANCIAYDFRQGAGVGFQFNPGTGGPGAAYAYNNTAHNCDVGFSGASGVRAKNNVAQDCTDGFSGSWHASSSHNLSDVASDSPGSDAVDSYSVTFVDEGNDDFHLNDSHANLTGTDLSADAAYPITTDIDGQTRTAWRRGADDGITSISVSLGLVSAGASLQTLTPVLTSGIVVALPTINAGADMGGGSLGILHELVPIAAGAQVQQMLTGVKVSLSAITAGATMQGLSVARKVALPTITARARMQDFLSLHQPEADEMYVLLQRRRASRSRLY